MSVPFKTYYEGLSELTVPLATDTIMIERSGVLYRMTLNDFVNVNPVKIFVDATIQSSVDIAGYTAVIVGKTDLSATVLTITDSTGNTITLDPLSIQGETVSLVLYGGVWYRV